MVRIIENNDEESARGQRVKKLVDIIKGNFDGEFLAIVGHFELSSLVSHKTNHEAAFYVFFERNLIDVLSQRYFDDAVRLAELYEANGESEFAVKRDY